MSLSQLSAMDDLSRKQDIKIASIDILKDRCVALQCHKIVEKTDLYRMADRTVSQQQIDQILKKTCEEYVQAMKKPFNKAHQITAMMECRQKKIDLELALTGHAALFYEQKPKNM